MNIDLSRFHQVFFDESAEHLAEMERLLLALDVDNPDIEELNAIFRAAHSIKGGSGSVGFTDMTEVTHILENLLDKLRKNELTLRLDMVDAFLHATDVLKEQLAAHMENGEPDLSQAEQIKQKLQQLAQGAGTSPAPEQTSSPATAPTLHTYLIEFPAIGDGNMSNLLESLAELGQMDIVQAPQTSAKHKGKKKKKEAPGIWKLKLSTTGDVASIRDLFEFQMNPDQVAITQDSPENTNEAYGLFEPAEPAYGLFDDIPAPPAFATEETAYGLFSDAPSAPTPVVEETAYGLFVDLPVATAPALATAEAPVIENTRTEPDRRAPDRRTTERRASERTGSESNSIRVGVEKVDQLINLVGELVITQAMLKQSAALLDPVLYEKLHNGMGQLERNTRDLQESVMSIRMMPISFVFSRFPRVVRDLAAKLSKQVELVMVGENTELDKSLIEKIADPLTHLVRNSLDHGIEIPEKRIAAGKPEKGIITLSASHQGGSIVIEVADDGAGLNRDRILTKAAERGLDTSFIQSDQDVWHLIFAPGFSTAEVVTDVSGRGVGMDVVMRNITELNGSVEINSEPGSGTRMTVRLPLTLAILDGMTVSLGESIFVIPLNLIVETLQPQAQDIKTVAKQGQMVQVRGEYLPVISLHETFNLSANVSNPWEGVLVLIEADGKKAALLVDALVGQQQVVIKSLETNFKKISGVSGATIMGDGTVAMILDVPALIRIGQSGVKD